MITALTAGVNAFTGGSGSPPSPCELSRGSRQFAAAAVPARGRRQTA
jgi:hypothetical protein